MLSCLVFKMYYVKGIHMQTPIRMKNCFLTSDVAEIMTSGFIILSYRISHLVLFFWSFQWAWLNHFWTTSIYESTELICMGPCVSMPDASFIWNGMLHGFVLWKPAAFSMMCVCVLSSKWILKACRSYCFNQGVGPNESAKPLTFLENLPLSHSPLK